MENFKKQALTFGGSKDLNLASGNATSDALAVTENYIWNLSPNRVANVTGAPTYTVQVSNNGDDWYDFDTELTNLAITSAAEVQGLSYGLIRVSVTANSATGTIGFEFVTKSY